VNETQFVRYKSRLSNFIKTFQCWVKWPLQWSKLTQNQADLTEFIGLPYRVPLKSVVRAITCKRTDGTKPTDTSQHILLQNSSRIYTYSGLYSETLHYRLLISYIHSV